MTEDVDDLNFIVIIIIVYKIIFFPFFGIIKSTKQIYRRKVVIYSWQKFDDTNWKKMMLIIQLALINQAFTNH